MDSAFQVIVIVLLSMILGIVISSRAGICTCFKWEFTINNNSDVRILDRDNRSGKFMGVQQLENQSHVIPIGRVSKSRYCLVTAEKFGCIHHLRK